MAETKKITPYVIPNLRKKTWDFVRRGDGWVVETVSEQPEEACDEVLVDVSSWFKGPVWETVWTEDSIVIWRRFSGNFANAIKTST